MNTLLITAIKGAIYAGAEIMKIYSEDFEVTLKQDNSPLTKADEEANSVINSYLVKTGIPIISEENKQVTYAIREKWDTCWMVDPLDGTKEFVKKNGEFTVNIALIKNNTPVVGVIYVPVSKTLYYGAVLDNKAYKCQLNSHEFTESIIQNSIPLVPQKKYNNQIKIVGSRSHKSKETNAFIQQLQSEGNDISLVSKGSSLKFCLVAEGSANIYPRFAPTMEWDTAAGHAICSAVGLKVMQVGLNEGLQYNKENLLNPYFIVQ
ncbi:3'(2'),5'-bisphosphate nucleotidase CysQ [Mariniflexile sp. AS56]|uniref:3'(2'),5'-bisphosphate nucleotidase CysQ n=1 Tax=Mariniflexile sp. AS56 TaxID=3063957 RepID=UPI0026F1AB84|nr:3'(2'),5'-bisphosphate nucleotidase CysQ [Mariniflexile sp. AS56]MDO7172743.1 3'(2'),5'-bisphosphate nucleotidase CysQ [Mariniflexile sp. AS56]